MILPWLRAAAAAVVPVLRVRAVKYTLYMGRDKIENEDLIKFGWPNDVWFHVSNLSSAHVYLRMPEGMSIRQIPERQIQERTEQAHWKAFVRSAMLTSRSLTCLLLCCPLCFLQRCSSIARSSSRRTVLRETSVRSLPRIGTLPCCLLCFRLALTVLCCCSLVLVLFRVVAVSRV